MIFFFLILYQLLKKYKKMIPGLKDKQKTILLFIWGLIALSILSCFSRPDYNIVCGFLILFLRSRNYGTKSLRCGIHILLLSIIFDIIWIIKYSSAWRHGEETSELWQSLSFTHNFAYLLGILEMLIKLPLLYIYFAKFKSSGGNNRELINFAYSK